jgi:hypothetical protein
MLVPDSDIRENMIQQTAELRYSVASAGLRELLAQRGHQALRSVQLACDQGDDVSIDLVLDDATAVRLNYREHYRTRQAIRIVDWEPLGYSDREMELAKCIVLHGDPTFDDNVRLYFDDNLAETDSALPPLQWGDRLWHAFEQPPD